MNQIINDINDVIPIKCCNGVCYNNHLINCNDVTKAVNKLKSGKSDGNTDQMSDHYKHGTVKCNVYMSLLFQAMLTHGVIPDSLLLGTIIPIPKNNRKSLNDSSNYRGITLSSIMGKILDNIILR